MGRRRRREERVAQALHIVRLHQITELDPAQGCPVPTRFCMYGYNLAYFDFDRESSAGPGPPFLELAPSKHKLLEGSVNVVSLTVHESDVGYPVRVFGTVLARDQVDYKCVYLFRRGRDDPQVITSPEDTLALTDPSRGFAVPCSMFFEIDLRTIDAGSGEAAVLSRGVIEHNACVVSDGKLLTSWRSTVRLAYTPVPFAVIATLTASVLHGARGFAGRVVARTSGNGNEIVLHDSGVPGTSTELGAGGSVALSRRLVAVPVDEKLVIRVHVEDGGGREAACFEGTLGHLDDWRMLCSGSHVLEVKAEWNGNTRRRDVYGSAGRTRLLL
ncbi:hypothetical protein C2845_PM06G04660 [Panicum miliaceum]|uniref:DUF6598 domain-containing protein n=1 Tax=Panicum miliaceum TaxID=4540 RepID=A0A3L6R6G4_PANMI|nr:hypothetical protein C2845_PM06G04660 [Panicum miliaceum]